MQGGTLLIDSDVFIVLSGAGLLERAIGVIGFQTEDARRLAPLPQMLGRSARLRKTYPSVVLQSARLACESIAPIVDAPDATLQERLLAIPDIDDGEALLYAILAKETACLLTSGDKRSMRALCGAADAATIRAAVSGRVVCLDSVVRKLVEMDGAAKTASALAPLLPHHATLRIVFSPANVVSAGGCLAAIDSYLGSLRGEVGEGFLREL